MHLLTIMIGKFILVLHQLQNTVHRCCGIYLLQWFKSHILNTSHRTVIYLVMRTFLLIDAVIEFDGCTAVFHLPGLNVYQYRVHLFEYLITRYTSSFREVIRQQHSERVFFYKAGK